jgi:subtilase family serine protease
MRNLNVNIRTLAKASCAVLAAIVLTAGARASAEPPASAAGTPSMRAACPVLRADHVRCLVEFVTRTGASQLPGARAARAAATPSGWGAKDIDAAYKLPVTKGSGQTVALVEAYDTPDLAEYLDTYRAEYGLPACNTVNGCFRKVNQAGMASSLPSSAVGTGWDLEATLDVDMVSAACPRCRILVVEATSDAESDMAVAEDTAARLGAQVISNSYGGREDGSAMTYAKAYDHPGHAIVVSSGDNGFTAASFPADLATVTAVGGTELARSGSKRGWQETVWNDGGASGSGCSAYVAKPSWQHDPDCGMRTVSDVSALASNVAIYQEDYGGWVTVAGTSAAAPLIAGVYALAGNAASIEPGYAYQHRGSLFDVTSGNNNALGLDGGAVCGNTYLCVAKPGYDAPTGLGTPDGSGAF